MLRGVAAKSTEEYVKPVITSSDREFVVVNDQIIIYSPREGASEAVTHRRIGSEGLLSVESGRVGIEYTYSPRSDTIFLKRVYCNEGTLENTKCRAVDTIIEAVLKANIKLGLASMIMPDRQSNFESFFKISEKVASEGVTEEEIMTLDKSHTAEHLTQKIMYKDEVIVHSRIRESNCEYGGFSIGAGSGRLDFRYNAVEKGINIEEMLQSDSSISANLLDYKRGIAFEAMAALIYPGVITTSLPWHKEAAQNYSSLVRNEAETKFAIPT